MSNLVLRRDEDIYAYIYADFVIEAQGDICVYICICIYVKRTSYKLSNWEMENMKRYMYFSIFARW